MAKQNTVRITVFVTTPNNYYIAMITPDYDLCPFGKGYLMRDYIAIVSTYDYIVPDDWEVLDNRFFHRPTQTFFDLWANQKNYVPEILGTNTPPRYCTPLKRA